MLQILESLGKLIVTLFNLVVNLLGAFVQLVGFIFDSIETVLTYTAYMPVWLLSFVILGIMVCVIKFSLNIVKGGAKNG